MIEIMLDISAVCFTLAVIFLAPLIYYLVVGQFKSPRLPNGPSALN